MDEITADGRPFGLERTIDGKRSYLFFPGIEADCATEPIDAGDPERSSIAKKFCAYLAIADQGIHRSHFGFPNFFIPFVTTNAARMEFDDGTARSPLRRRIENVFVQKYSRLRLSRTTGTTHGPHAEFAVAADRIPAARARPITPFPPQRALPRKLSTIYCASARILGDNPCIATCLFTSHFHSSFLR